MKRFSTLLVVNKMEIKVTMQYYYTLTRMAKMNKADIIKYWQGCGVRGSKDTLGKLLALSIKAEHIYIRIPPPGMYPTNVHMFTTTRIFIAAQFVKAF